MDIDVKVSAIIEYQGKIALIREKLTKNHNYKWNVCGGGWEPSDGSFQNVVIREAREEAGLEVAVGELYRLVLVKLEVGHTLRVFFTAQANSDSFRLAKPEQQAKLEEDIVECRWFAKSEIAAWEDSEFVSSTTAKVIKDYAQGKKFSPAEQAIYLDHQTRF